MQADGINVNVTRIVRRERGGQAQFCQRSGLVAFAYQQKPKSVMQVRGIWQVREAASQYLLAFGVASELTVSVCKIDIRARETCIEKESSLVPRDRFVETLLPHAQVTEIDVRS